METNEAIVSPLLRLVFMAELQSFVLLQQAIEYPTPNRPRLESLHISDDEHDFDMNTPPGYLKTLFC